MGEGVLRDGPERIPRGSSLKQNRSKAERPATFSAAVLYRDTYEDKRGWVARSVRIGEKTTLTGGIFQLPRDREGIARRFYAWPRNKPRIKAPYAPNDSTYFPCELPSEPSRQEMTRIAEGLKLGLPKQQPGFTGNPGGLGGPFSLAGPGTESNAQGLAEEPAAAPSWDSRNSPWVPRGILPRL